MKSVKKQEGMSSLLRGQPAGEGFFAGHHMRRYSAHPFTGSRG
jgi:hypothetical protein